MYIKYIFHQYPVRVDCSMSGHLCFCPLTVRRPAVVWRCWAAWAWTGASAAQPPPAAWVLIRDIVPLQI